MSPESPSVVAVLAANFVTQALAYFALVGTVFLVIWKWGAKRFQGSRIPVVPRLDGAQLKHEVRHTLVTLVVGMSSAGLVMIFQARGLGRLVTSPVPLWQTLAWAAGLLVFNDFWFYAWHRSLHHPKIFRYVHAVHHKSVDVNPFTSYSFHGFEGFILGAWIVPAALLLPVPMSTLMLVQVIGLLNNVMSHLGYEFLPRWLLKVPLLRWTNTATFHSLHHTRLRGNYGLHSRIWDRLFNTELPEYEETFLARGSAPNGKVAASPSIPSDSAVVSTGEPARS